MTFHVGQKVVCVKRGSWSFNACGGPAHGPSFKQICIVRGFDNNVFRGLLLEGFYGNSYADGSERGYAQERFRPVVERKPSIEIFTAMLNPSKQGVDA